MAAVPADEPALHPLDLTPLLGRAGHEGHVVTSPARRCAYPGATVDPAWGPWDLGSWTGRAFDELDLGSWRADPGYRAHGGESLRDLHDRVGATLAGLAGTGRRTDGAPLTGRLVVVTHAAVVKAAVVIALGAPDEASWSLDVAPGTVTELHVTGGRWRVTRVSASLTT